MEKTFFTLFALVLGIAACGPKDPVEPPAVFDPTAFDFKIGDFPDPELPADNLPTRAGVLLGRMLFYEKGLSKDGSQACADCHRQAGGFSDSSRLSIGVEKKLGHRQAMPLGNLAWSKNGFFWDGRAATLREQALKPIQDALEMNETLPNVVAKLSAEKKYVDQFIRAFGDSKITPERVGLAIEQFEFTMISNGSKYDKWQRGEAVLTDAEERGRRLFFTEYDPFGGQKGAECFHCHSGATFSNDEFMNNGLDADGQQADAGREKVTNSAADRAKFRTPSLRNVARTAPFMHDGRFATLAEVIEQYDSRAKNSATADVLLQYNLQPGGLKLTATDKTDLVAFLNALTDADFLADPAFSKLE